MTGGRASEVVEYVQRTLRALADPAVAGPMAAYMKTDMAFYGVKAPARRAVGRDLWNSWPPSDADEAWEIIDALWALEHREEKYLAIGYARKASAVFSATDLDRIGSIIVDGAWWDLVDELATHVVGPIVRRHPERAWPVIEAWNAAESMWLRRTSIICQLGSKDATDEERLFRFILARADESEFFIRKAIGWALREYAKTNPEAVRSFVARHEAVLSPLSRREALKHLG